MISAGVSRLPGSSHSSLGSGGSAIAPKSRATGAAVSRLLSEATRTDTVRSSRAAPSARSTWRPSQCRWSATRLGRSLPLRRSASGWPGGGNSETGATGPDDNTHTSFEPWPDSSDSSLLERPTDIRARPPRITS